MENKEAELNQDGSLRYQAEEHFKNGRGKSVGFKALEEMDAQAIIHALQIHQIELEKQNDELKRAGADMENAVMKYSYLYDFAPTALFTLDQQGEISEVNHAGAALLGMDRKNLLGKRFLLFLAPEDRASFNEFFQKVLDTSDRQTSDFILVRDECFRVNSELDGISIRDDLLDSKQCQIAVTDITERKRIEQTLIESERRSWSMIEQSRDGICLLDECGCVSEWNAGMERMTQLRKADVIGRFVWDIHFNLACNEFRTPEIFSRIKSSAIEALRTGQSPFLNRSSERIIQRPDGTRLTVEEIPFAIPNEKGFMICSIMRDITERIRMEEELQKSKDALKEHSEHLEKLVEERTMELKEADRMATIGKLVAMVGHDLRNPLQVITAMAYLAREKLKCIDASSMSRPTVAEVLDSIEVNCDFMNKIVSDLQDYARPLGLELAKTDIHKLINSALAAVEFPCGVQTSIEIENTVPDIIIDEGKIRRVLINLITNSIQSMPRGGHLSISASYRDGLAFLIITDTGVGISEESRLKLFQPLTTTKTKGVGLGLAICKRLVEAHKGNITIKSEIGVGTEVTVQIPTSMV